MTCLIVGTLVLYPIKRKSYLILKSILSILLQINVYIRFLIVTDTSDLYLKYIDIERGRQLKEKDAFFREEDQFSTFILFLVLSSQLE